MSHIKRNLDNPQEPTSKMKRFFMWLIGKGGKESDPKRTLDFEVHCVFDHQLRPYGCPSDGDLVEVKMQSGKTGLYKAEHLKNWPGHTGQRDWKFWFQDYKEEGK